MRRHRETYIQGRWPCESRGRDGSSASTSHHQKPEEARKDSTQNLVRSLPTPWFLISGLQSCEMIHFHCLSTPVSSTVLEQPQETRPPYHSRLSSASLPELRELLENRQIHLPNVSISAAWLCMSCSESSNPARWHQHTHLAEEETEVQSPLRDS